MTWQTAVLCVVIWFPVSFVITHFHIATYWNKHRSANAVEVRLGNWFWILWNVAAFTFLLTIVIVNRASTVPFVGVTAVTIILLLFASEWRSRLQQQRAGIKRPQLWIWGFPHRSDASRPSVIIIFILFISITNFPWWVLICGLLFFNVLTRALPQFKRTLKFYELPEVSPMHDEIFRLLRIKKPVSLKTVTSVGSPKQRPYRNQILANTTDGLNSPPLVELNNFFYLNPNTLTVAVSLIRYRYISLHTTPIASYGALAGLFVITLFAIVGLLLSLEAGSSTLTQLGILTTLLMTFGALVGVGLLDWPCSNALAAKA